MFFFLFVVPDGRTLTSAWIETYWHLCISEQGNVALSRVRGLKQYMFEQLAISSIGRTLTSAWIETFLILASSIA